MLHTLGGLHLEGAARQQAGPLVLLVYLALEGSQERRSVQELFFPGHADAAGRLRMMLHRIKQAAPDALETPGTRLETRLPSDAAELFRAAERGQAAEVLSLYRGRFLDGVRLPGAQDLEEWVFATRERLTARVRFSHLTVGRAAALRGEPGLALTHAERAYLLPGAPEPDLGEAQLMALVLTAAGSAFAADARSEVRHLDQQVPEQAAEALHRLASGHETPGPSRLTVSGAAEAERGSEEPPGASAGPEVPPASAPLGVSAAESGLTTLLGREHELAQLEASYVSGARLVTVLGQGGMGKTLLARHALSRAVLRYAAGPTRAPEDVRTVLLPGLMVDLSAVSDESGVLPAIASASQARTASPDDVAQAVRAYELLVLDNFEQVLGAAPQVSSLLEAAPDLRVLVTSRERLNLAQEHVLPLSGLSVQPGALQVKPGPPIGVWTEAESGAEPPVWSDAARLFVRRAARAHLGFEAEPHRQGIEQVCTLLQGVPLLIELASAWVRTLSPAEIAAQLDEGRTRGADLSEPDLNLLETRDRNVPARHASARTVLEASWRRLSADDQAQLARLSVFLSDFTVKAARQITGATLSALANLTDKSWLGSAKVSAGAGSAARLSWHPMARAFVREMSGGWETGNWQQMLPAHAHYFAQGLDASRFQVESLADLLGEWPDIGQAVRTLARSPDDWPTLIRLAKEVPGWADQVGNYASVAGLIGRVLDALPPGAAPRAPLLHARAFMWKNMHRIREAMADYRQAADLLRHSDDVDEMLTGLDALALAHQQAAEYGQAQAIWLEVLTHVHALSEHKSVRRTAYVKHQLAVNAIEDGRLLEAEAWINEAIQIEESIPARGNLVLAYSNLGMVLTRLDRRAEAQVALEEGLRLAHQMHADAFIPKLLNFSALNLLEMDRAEEAVELCLEALQRDQLNLPSLRADMMDTLALCYAGTGQVPKARQALAQSTALTLQTRDSSDLLHRICTYTIVETPVLSASDRASILHWLLQQKDCHAPLRAVVLKELRSGTQTVRALPALDSAVISTEAQHFCGYHAGELVRAVPDLN